MSIALPISAIIIAVLAAALLPESRRTASAPKIGVWIALAVLLAAGGIVALTQAAADMRGSVLIGLAAGMAVALIGSLFDGEVGYTPAFAIGVAGAVSLSLLDRDVMGSDARSAFIVGAALASLALRLAGSGGMASIALLAAASVFALDLLGGATPGTGRPGSMLGLGLAVGGVLVALSSSVPRLKPVRAPLALGLALLAGWAVSTQYPGLTDMLTVVALALVSAMVVHWTLTSEGGGEPMRAGIAGLIWVAVATVAYGLGRDAGMATALLVAVAYLVAIGNSRALITTGILLVLVYFRIFRSEYAEAGRTLDISQHYAIIGLMAGALIPLMPSDWMKDRTLRGSMTVALVAVLWSVLLLASPVLAAIFLSVKGLVGFIFGLGFASFIHALRSERGLLPLDLAAGLTAVTLIAYGWLGDLLTLSRNDKVWAVGYATGAVLLNAMILAFLARRPLGEEAS